LQGREKDVAIFSTVRTQVGRSIGFVADERRMNVGLTRARSSLIVIGNAKALKGDERWGNLIKQATVDRSASGGPVSFWFWLCHDMTCCDELCCAVLCCAVLSFGGFAVTLVMLQRPKSLQHKPAGQTHLFANFVCICMIILHWIESVLMVQMSLPAC